MNISRRTAPSWAEVTSFPGVDAVTCPSTGTCQAFGTKTELSGGAVAIGTSDSGAKWVSERLPSGVTAANAVSCPTHSVCFAVGSTLTAAVVLRL